MSIFIDTGIWIGFFNLTDDKSDRSTEIIEEIQKGMYGIAWSSSFIIDELYTYLERKTRNTQLAIDSVNIVFGKKEDLKPFVKIQFISFENCIQALNLAKKYSDKRMSFTDLTSLVICSNLNIGYIASYDTHFKGIIPTIS